VLILPVVNLLLQFKNKDCANNRILFYEAKWLDFYDVGDKRSAYGFAVHKKACKIF